MHEIEEDFLQACDEVGVSDSDGFTMMFLFAPLRYKNEVTYQHYLHSLRVALLARAIAKFTRSEERPLIFAGALHDIGKAQVPLDVLGKTTPYTEADYMIMSEHVMDSYRLIRDRFDFTAEIILWHHRFQKNWYPKTLPPPLHDYSESTKLRIIEYGRILALADCYDALHRPNSKFKEGGGLSGEELKAKMLELNPDRKKLVEALYEAGIFKV